MRFVFPNAAYERQAKEYIQEFIDHGSETHGVGGLRRFLEEGSYTDWLANCMKYIDIANVPGEWVPGYTYFYVDNDDQIVGMINIRLYLNDFLRGYGGHIGYSVRPTRRRQGHGTNMLRGALEFLARIGLRDVLVTCDKANIASAKVIQGCGGVLEKEYFREESNAVIQMYWIHANTQTGGI